MEKQYLQSLIDRKLSIRGIAREVDVSGTTVRYWLKRYNLTTNPQWKREDKDYICTHHGKDSPFYVTSQGKRVCKQCAVERTTRYRRERKAKLVEEAGGGCQHCPYKACLDALSFHHTNPTEKITTVSRLMGSITQARAEAQKCILLCHNCHAEEEDQLQSKRYKELNAKTQAVTNHRLRQRERLLQLYGNQCQQCFYKNSLRALHFHHRDPVTKMMSLDLQSMAYAWERIVEEAAKCDLLCGNCHAEHHSS